MICLPSQGIPPPNTAANMAHSTHSTQPALRPHRAIPRAEKKPQTRRPHSNGLFSPFLVQGGYGGMGMQQLIPRGGGVHIYIYIHTNQPYHSCCAVFRCRYILTHCLYTYPPHLLFVWCRAAMAGWGCSRGAVCSTEVCSTVVCRAAEWECRAGCRAVCTEGREVGREACKEVPCKEVACKVVCREAVCREVCREVGCREVVCMAAAAVCRAVAMACTACNRVGAVWAWGTTRRWECSSRGRAASAQAQAAGEVFKGQRKWRFLRANGNGRQACHSSSDRASDSWVNGGQRQDLRQRGGL